MDARLQELFEENEMLAKDRVILRCLLNFFKIEKQNRILAIFDVEKNCFDAVSQSCKKFLGYEPNELIGNRYEKFIVYQGDIERSEQAIEGNLQGTEVVGFVNSYRHKSGHEVFLSWDVSFVEENKTICIATLATDSQIQKIKKLRHEKEKESQTHAS